MGGLLLASGCERRDPPAEELASDVISSSATRLARAIARKEISSEAVARACVDRITAVNPKLNAVVRLAADGALERARSADRTIARGESWGPLHGVPMTIKDSFDTAGVVSTAGTLGRRDEVPREDATVVSRLKAAGAILLGKTNTPELTFAAETDNLVYGRTNNPYDTARTPGGSSGGAAAIVAACGSPFDIGSDTGGSIRIPGHFCGIAGIKPTSGRVPRTGHIVGFDYGLEFLTALGPLARRVEDLETLLPILCGPDGRDPGIVPVALGSSRDVELEGLRVAYYTDNGTLPADADTSRVVRTAVEALSRGGLLVREERPAPIVGAVDLAFSLILADGGAGIQRRLDRAGTATPHPWVAQSIDLAKAVSSIELTAREEAWATYRREMLAFLDGCDLIVCPVWPTSAPLHSKPGETMSPGVFYTLPYNLTGWPAAVVRCGASSDGLPIGVQIVGAPFREDTVLKAAFHLEAALGGYQPPTI
jgi:amidase